MRGSLEDRTNFISCEDYVRCYSYFEGETRAREIVEGIFAHLQANPDEHIILEPKFIAVLALFSEEGRKLAPVYIGSPSEVLALQREVAAVSDSLVRDFPQLGLT